MNRSLIAILMVASLLGTVGCAPMMRKSSGGVVPGRTFDRSAKILVLAIPDGVEEDGPAVGSGLAVYSAIRDTLIAKGFAIMTTDKTDLATGFEQASSLGCRYLLRGMIPEWEDNATEWSGKPDVASLSVELYDALDRSLNATGSHRIASSTAQMLSRRPDRFIPEIVDQAMSKVFGWQPTEAAEK